MSSRTEKSKTVVWLCVGGGAVIGTIAGILAQINHPAIAVWLGWFSIVLWGWGARTYVGYKHPARKTKATAAAMIVAILLIPAAWRVQTNAAAPPTVHVESRGDHSPNIVGNSGPVTIQGDSGKQDTPQSVPSKPKGKDK